MPGVVEVVDVVEVVEVVKVMEVVEALEKEKEEVITLAEERIEVVVEEEGGSHRQDMNRHTTSHNWMPCHLYKSNSR